MQRGRTEVTTTEVGMALALAPAVVDVEGRLCRVVFAAEGEPLAGPMATDKCEDAVVVPEVLRCQAQRT